MSKIKIKKQIKKLKRQQRKNEFGFVKTKQLDEIEGDDKGYYLDSSPFLAKEHEKVEEVLVVNDGKKELVKEKPRFSELSSMSVSQLVQSAEPITISDQDQEELGFFFDSMPSIEKSPPKKKKATPKDKKKEHKQKIIQDDSVYIALTDEDDEEDEDDHLSVSSSEDIEIIKSLAHWGKQDNMNQLEIDTFKKRRRRSLDAMDYHLLESMSIKDIVEDDTQLDQDDLLLTEELDFEQELVNVPTGLIQNYKGLIREEKNRYNQERRFLQKKKMKDEDAESNTILEEIIHEFIDRQDIESYDFKNLTAHGRNIIVPKIAKLFQLKTLELDTNFVKLEKTVNTCIPTSFKYYLNQQSQQQQQQQQVKKKKRSSRISTTTTRNNRNNNEVNHGKQVAIGSAPISSNNIGHRMLSAMGWKEGETIGNNEDGIKEPIKVFMRANRRGLGA